MPQRPSKDNVIYANFGAKKRVSSPEELPASRETIQFNAVARKMRDLVHQYADQGRLKRGRDYARNSNVLNVKLDKSTVSADVAGSQNEPFHVTISLPYRDTDDLAAVTAELAELPNGIKRAKEGKLSEDISEILIGSSAQFWCDCPDHVVCCKHAVAVAYVVADRLEAEPLLAFELRGLDLLKLEQSLTMQARSISERDVKTHFWDGKALPDLPSPKKAPALEDSDESLLRKAMRLVSLTSIDELKAVADIEDLYYYLTRE
ncbi:hypothetical protein [Corynebacterium pseudotuberculosis]|uniref:SWIM-type domain-containing protein n=1 Tax=Corynebacterium pseudotuberculosis (strain C231) TaxID=681645 RepID=D9Q9S4_CORP2|nr:hypothetical protein [Corynebacterium pseudotuberculosis]ADK28612.1 hypothetical protein CPFRC_04110 [Corynebacterium pseudotuberculosis FRC41]ADL10300.1 hypothetical protein CPC231_04110 [Corynebacterium pseudotuberculosis C231]ADL20705.1 hypothetical protein CP1002_09025 [Corynebacterium pseudotuberculosis 1002]ADO26092.1 hypothetical protein CPI19_07410 [Corynebacterium pseudotuberculosis I19]AEK92148.1 Hypothetical protein CpPAT10_0816 [Corynebacterium pseudotuberculosis PAT10]